MAHFAQIKDGVVQQVVVISNEVINNAEGLLGEDLGIAYCKSLFGEETEWVQTSYNANFRGKYAGISDLWDGNTFISTHNSIH
jgi:hypothetical protein